jgi:hypothetical protein
VLYNETLYPDEKGLSDDLSCLEEIPSFCFNFSFSLIDRETEVTAFPVAKLKLWINEITGEKFMTILPRNKL